jgi:hypothetical protein
VALSFLKMLRQRNKKQSALYLGETLQLAAGVFNGALDGRKAISCTDTDISG